ncbi:unnamed protein product [Tilletia controversa]|uniref:NADAR domain-containing protein n=1 Tax=Tilletia controversa TaxID=13291 RepID=A0A8X7MVM6_9BASI|nr:hypothetical protein CF328_g3980 [Tilletia controversa]KAE8248760.1 hypothetical protein A4X06_0g3534 [Tilletia controversa]CAD6943393.1 unnamed protein product [Tilletia controversa]CAD6954224.1 unnamed protein product [Tilletia controversa]CAD6978491.1 unnamed protein product [Tilletia controversa]
METIEVVAMSEVSSERSATPTEEPVVVEPEAAKTPAIRFGSATEPFFFLSNSFPSRIAFGAFGFPNAEAAFQAAKFREHPTLQLAIVNTKWPGDVIDKARDWIDYVPEDWEERRLSVMKEVLMLKYTQNDQLQARLLQTGDAELIYTSRIDDYFGQDRHGHGQNHLGNILMNVRAILRTHPGELSECFKSSTCRPTSRSTVWCMSHTSEKWYPLGTKRLQAVTIEPAVEDASASSYAFLHSISHGNQPWRFEVLIQVRAAAATGAGDLWVHFHRYDDVRYSPYGHRVDPGNFDKQVQLSSENLKATAKGGADVLIYGVHVDLPPHDGETKIYILPSKSATRPEQPNYTLSVTTAAA